MGGIALITIEEFKKSMKSKGWCSFDNFIDESLLGKMLVDLHSIYDYCRAIQLENGVENSEGTCHHIVGRRKSFMECLSRYETIDSYLTEYFGGKYILNSYGGNLLKKDMSYANNIHRDIRSFSGDLPLMLNTLIMLDDFTEENGATWLMHRGHEWDRKPTDEEFDDYKFQITGKAGTLVVWNSNMWHRAGKNNTDKLRRSLTPEFTRPFMKQGYDYPRAIKKPESPYLQQVLGFNSRIPATLEEWYKPKTERFYKDGQG